MDAERKELMERREGDEMIRMTLCGGQVRVMMCETTNMVQRAADIHNATLQRKESVRNNTATHVRK